MLRSLMLSQTLRKTVFKTVAALTFSLLPWASHAADKLIIIIDDVGNNKKYGEQIIALPGKITYAFLPHTPHAKSLAQKAFETGKEVMLHQPMANKNNAPLGPGGLTQSLTEAEFKATLAGNIASIPHVSGVNNHMGSALTQHPKAMEWVMDVVKQHDLYFVDSLTSAKSVAQQTAQHHEIANLKRHVFLDHEKDPLFLEQQFSRAIRIAKKHPLAVLIGHPYPETIEYLTSALATLDQHDVELVFPSEILKEQIWYDFQPNIDTSSFYQLSIDLSDH